MDVQDIVGETIESTDFIQDNSFGFDFNLTGSNVLSISAAGHGELWLNTRLNGSGTPIECVGKTIASIDYDGSTERRSLTIEFTDGDVLECEANGREEVWIQASAY